MLFLYIYEKHNHSEEIINFHIYHDRYKNGIYPITIIFSRNYKFLSNSLIKCIYENTKKYKIIIINRRKNILSIC